MATKYWVSTSSTSFTTAANWSTASAPADGDVLIFGPYGTANVETDLGNGGTGGLQTLTIIIEPGYTGQIGLVSAAGVPTYLTIDGGTLKMPRYPNSGNQPGSQQVMINFGATAATCTIDFTNTLGASNSIPPVQLLGTALTLSMTGGSAGVAVRAGEVSTLASTLRLSAGTGGQVPTLVLGRGVTGSSCDAVSAGNVLDMRDQTMLSIRNFANGRWEYVGTGATTTLYADGGTVIYSGTGTITAATVKPGATVNLEQDPRAKTITDCTVEDGGRVLADTGVPGSVTFTNAIEFPDGFKPGMLTLPKGMKATIATI